MQVVPGLTWNEAVEKAKKLEVDVLPCVGVTEDRESFLNFSIPYMNFHRVIITRTDTPFLTGLEDIQDLRVAVQGNSSHEGYLKEHSEIDPQLYKTLQEALVATSEGNVDAFIGNIASVTYWIRKQNLTNLKVAAPVSHEMQRLHFAVRSDWPELIQIINKGLSSISLAKENRIRRRWITVEYVPGLDPGIVKKRVLQVLGIFLLILIGILAWNYRLTKEIRKREIVEEALRQAHEKLEYRVEERTAALSEANKNLEQEISERQRTEAEKDALAKQLLRIQKLEAIGTLAGGIAHDFNNILTPILIYTEMSLLDLPADNLVRHHLEEVMTAGHRATSLVKQILAFSRKAEQKHIPLQLNLICQEAVKFLRASIPTTIEIKQDLRDTSYILADPVQMHQVIVNLCTNAAQAMASDKKGLLELNLRKIAIDGSLLDLKHGEYLKLSVRDTGYGMTADVQQQIFDPFFTTKKEEGTGLGLSVAHGIVISHGGAITVKSTPGKGSTFTVYLPVLKKVVLKDLQENIPIPSGSERILLLDDEVKIIEANKEFLAMLGYEVIGCTDPHECLELFKNDPKNFDLIITDMTMPGMTGIDLVKEIFKIRPDVPVILESGLIKENQEAELKALGIKKVISKPATMSNMATAIREVLDKT